MSDLIDRQTAIDAIEKLILPQLNKEISAEEINRTVWMAWRCAINCAKDMIEYLPSAEKTGKWIKHAENFYACSICNTVVHTNFNYCPNCGALMKGE